VRTSGLAGFITRLYPSRRYIEEHLSELQRLGIRSSSGKYRKKIYGDLEKESDIEAHFPHIVECYNRYVGAERVDHEGKWD